MVAQSQDCDRHRLSLLLTDDLDEKSRREVELHLSDCGTCQHDLETLASEAETWQKATSFLVRDANDPETSERQFTQSSLWNAAAAATLDTDFVIEQLTPSDNPAMLGRIGKYEILEVIGRGGMGVVLKGYDYELNRYVAVKVLAPHYAASAAARRRFAREAQAAAAIVHPNVLAIHAVESDEKLPYLVMPLIAGETLQQRIDRDGPLELKDILRIALQAAQGLAAAHSQGLVHRDVKPANILLDGSVDRVLLSDFGLARTVDDATLTRSGIIAGTPHYMSPEQSRGESLDHRSDLFSLGSVIYAMSTGRPPFRAETALGIARKVDEAEPQRLHEINSDLPAWLNEITQRLMEKSLESRFQSASEVAELLEQCLAHAQQPSVAPLPELLTRHPTSANARGIALMLSIPAIMAAIFIVLMNSGRDHDVNTNTQPSPTKSTEESQSTATSKDSATVAADDEAFLDWDDDVGQEIDSLSEDFDRIEFEVRPLKSHPQFETSKTNSNPTQ